MGTVHYQHPVNVTYTIISEEEVLISWSPVFQTCPAVFYNINASSDCGDGPDTTKNNSVTYQIKPVMPQKPIICEIAIQTVVCDNINGPFSEHHLLFFGKYTSINPCKQNLTIVVTH